MEDQPTINDKLSQLQSESNATQTVVDPIKPIKKPECKNYGLLALIGLLLVVSAVGWYLYLDLRGVNAKTVTQLVTVSNEKEEVTNELKELIVQYEDMKSDNEEVNAQLAEEQQKIEGLIEELKKVKDSNRWQINKYKKELFTLREIMKSYIYQIDSLNTMNINLRQENSVVTAENKRIATKNEKLEQLTENLSTTVEKASILRAVNILPEALKKKGKETNRTSKVEKIKVCFTLVENAVAENGNQWVYLRIINPQGQVLSGSQNVEVFGETEIPFSDKREIEYDNKDIDVCIFWAKSEDLTEGEYKVEIVSKGNVIGTSAFYLK